MFRLLILFLLMPAIAASHPGWGVQVDTEGHVYFTDLQNVLVADASGKVRVLMADVHTHALYLDSEEQLVGDHSWVDQDGVFRFSWWRVDPAGRKTELSEYEAAEYFGMKLPGGGRLMPESHVGQKRAELIHLRPDGSRLVAAGGPFGSKDGVLAEAQFGVFGAQVSDGQGGLLVTSGGQLRAIDSLGNVTTLLGQEQGFPFDAERRSGLLGLAMASNGDLFVADIDRRRLVQLQRSSRKVLTASEADLTWIIAGVDIFGTDVYLLEYSRLPWSDKVRVRLLDRQGRTQIFAHNQ